MGIRSNEIYGGLIPIGGVKPSFKGRIALIGDAAAQVKPFTGGGLIYGFTCAKIASETIIPKKPETLKTYDLFWRKRLAKQIFLGQLIRLFYKFPHILQNVLFAMARGEINSNIDRPSTFYKQLFRK